MGQMIGKKGSNIRHLQYKSGARIAVNGDAGFVTVTGSAPDISAAVNLLQAQFASWRSSGTCTAGFGLTLRPLLFVDCKVQLKIFCPYFQYTRLCCPRNVAKSVAQTVRDCMSNLTAHSVLY